MHSFHSAHIFIIYNSVICTKSFNILFIITILFFKLYSPLNSYVYIHSILCDIMYHKRDIYLITHIHPCFCLKCDPFFRHSEYKGVTYGKVGRVRFFPKYINGSSVLNGISPSGSVFTNVFIC